MATLQKYTCVIASGASTSSYIDRGDMSHQYLAVYYGTMSTGAALGIYGSADGTSFYPVHERVNTATVQYQAISVATSTSGAWAHFKSPPCRYIQFVASAVVSGGVNLTVLAGD